MDICKNEQLELVQFGIFFKHLLKRIYKYKKNKMRR